MSLRNYKAATRTIRIDDENSVSVRALGFDDLQRLVIAHPDLIEAAVKLFQDKVETPEDMRSFGAVIVGSLPELVGHVIATAADEDDLAQVAMRLPAPVALDVILAVHDLTFSEPTAMTRFFGQLSGILSTIPTASRLSSGPGGSASPATLNS